MAHLHIPDGVLPPWLWGPAWLVTVAVLLLVWRLQRHRPPQRIAYEGALGALMLAAMAMEVPLGPIEYHLTLAAPIGVLLGPAGAFQAAFIASAVLAFIGHGGLTLIGLNALLLGTAASLATPAYRYLSRGRASVAAFAGAAAIAHSVSAALWLTLVLASAHFRAVGLALESRSRIEAVSGATLPLVVFSVFAETAVAFGMGHFILRVRPDLMPGTWIEAGGPSR